MPTTSSRFFDAVRTFADNVLQHGRDVFRHTPLLIDGLNIHTMRPVEWLCDGQRWVICNPACRQHLYRTFAGLSNLTGDSHYRQAAADEMQHLFSHYVDSNGLLRWGGHQFVDLQTGNVVGEQSHHEFKTCYPFYEFLWQTNPPATERFIKALWNAHVYDWSKLDMSRHGIYDQPMGKLWDSEYVGGEPFFPAKGLTFINAGSDLIWAAGLLHHFTKDAGALTWAKRLALRYVEARDPNTQLGAYQYSQPAQRENLAEGDTRSWGGDRARRQFGPEFGDSALEGKMLASWHAERIYGHSAISQLRLAELLGDAGREFIQWNHTGLLAFAKHAYDPQTNLVHAMFTDGKRITPADVKRPGYYRAAAFAPTQTGTLLLLSYALCFRLTRDPALWQTARHIARGNGLGDIGAAPNSQPQLNQHTQSCDPLAIFALLEMFHATGCSDYLALAQTIGDNTLRACFHRGFFLPTRDHINARFGTLEPLALLHLEAAARGQPDSVPKYPAGLQLIHGPFNGLGRAKDDVAIWSKTSNG